MDGLEHKRIRRLYYLGNIAAILIVVISLSIPYVTNLRNEYSRKVKQLSDSIIDQKKLYIKTVILSKISDIESIREGTQKEYTNLAKSLFHSISFIIKKYYRSGGELASPAVNNLVSKLPLDNLNFTVTDSRTGRILVSSDPDQPAGSTSSTSNADTPVLVRKQLFHGTDLNVFMTQNDYDNLVQERVIENIRNTRLPDSGYIWINHVLNYAGGDDYARRLVHPNLPDTEGMMLSTHITDVEGNHPYKKELEGVKKYGEIFFEYYFKKMGSDVISHKLTYARLYKRYDWIVATGVYLDDVDQLIAEEMSNMRATLYSRIVIELIIAFLALVMAVLIVVRFEIHVHKLITGYTDELAGAYSRIKKIAYSDVLTGLWNRRAMYGRLHEELSRSTRTKDSFCIVMSDVDHFKHINDTFGHEAGDYVLKEVAGLMKKNLREEDSISRWGGEEFLILITGADLELGRGVSEKLREEIEKSLFVYKGQEIQVTMTFGVVSFDEGETLEQLISGADKKLYAGKEKSRNCVTG